LKVIFLLLLFVNLFAEDKTLQMLEVLNSVLQNSTREDISKDIIKGYNPFDSALLSKPTLSEDNKSGEVLGVVVSEEPTKLQALFGRKKAMIDGVWVGAGEEIKGYKLEKIYKNSVLLVKNGQKKELKLFENSLLRSVK